MLSLKNTTALLFVAVFSVACGTGSVDRFQSGTEPGEIESTDTEINDDVNPTPVELNESSPVTADDIVDLGDLIEQEAAAESAAAQVGDPAQLLGIAQDEAEAARTHVAAVFHRMRQATEGEPTHAGIGPDGRPYAIWVKQTDGGLTVRFTAVRTAPKRLRYLMQAKADGGQFKGLLTGVFVRHAPKLGGGRFHLDLSNLSDLGVGPNLDGSIHFAFANKDLDKRGRRIAYINVTDRDQPGMLPNHAVADLVRKVGVGGRFRSVVVGDLIEQVPGREVMGLKVAWRAGIGGRGVARVAALNGGNPVGLNLAHECWDADGLRLAYHDTFDGNDDVNPNEGTIADCAGIAAADLEEVEPTGDNVDVQDPAAETGEDEELNDILSGAGVDDITDEEASEGIDIGS